MSKSFKSRLDCFFLTMIVFICLSLTNNLYAAEVIAVDAKAKTVTIDEELTEGSKVCFFTKADKKIGCGKVNSTDTHMSVIKVSKKLQKKVAIGTLARAVTAGEVSVSGENAAKETSKVFHRIKLNYIYTVLSPSVYSLLLYDFVNAPTGMPWKEYKKDTSAMAGAALSGEIPVSKSLALSMGLRYRKFDGQILKADYDPAQRAQYIETKHSMMAYGLWTDLYFLNLALSPSFNLRFSGGLDLDVSTANFTATLCDDRSPITEEIASADSKGLKVISLRLGSEFTMAISKPMAIHLGLNALIPAFAMASSFSAQFADSINDENREETLKEKIGHKKASFGAEVIVGAQLFF